ncbi:MAG: protease modulator HflC [Holosporaceae bacterium]|jgi:membrane protease subunit HflC|nr:protease modulator HflC [Holosporaceae bacterium]
MTKNRMLPIALSIGVLFTLLECLFTVNQIAQVVVTRFGEPVRIIQEPGLHFKFPLIEKVVYFDKRLMSVELSAMEITLGDKRRIMVDAFGRYIIKDPLKFYQTVYSEKGVLVRLNPVVLGSLSSVLGSVGLSSLLSDTRISAMNKIRDEVNRAAKRFGIDVVDVRIRKTDLPVQNSAAICKRMISEREREACELRAKGIEMSKTIKSNADKESSIEIAKANTKVQELIAEGEKEANAIYAAAFSKDANFFEFFQSLEAYRASFTLGQNETTFILSSKNPFFSAMNNNR